MLTTGARLRSQVCSTEVIVVRAGSSEATLHCGGFPMIDLTAAPQTGLTLAPKFTGGTLIGKRYTDADDTVEVLVTKAGGGNLALGGVPLMLKTAKPLPASD